MSQRPVIAPVHLGCCRDRPRCILCPPPPAMPDTEYVQAMVDNYRRERVSAGDDLWVGFFGGPPPDDGLVRAAAVPAMMRVRPDLLSRVNLAESIDAGVRFIELDVLSF
ncbi:MAG: hypothetical protein HN348_18565, partial [Proteobacteria bacterium]|nr:hypothetical protein [Pseudomonadota bacterium]